MPRNQRHRVTVLEEQLADNDYMDQHRQELTWQANLRRVPTSVLLEGLLGVLERAWGQSDSQVPEFVNRALYRPVPEAELHQLRNVTAPVTQSDWEIASSANRFIVQNANHLRRLKPDQHPFAMSDEMIPRMGSYRFFE